MDIQQLRAAIDDIDEQLVTLFVRRMGAAKDIAEYKRRAGLPIYDRAREREVLVKVAELAGEPLADDVKALYMTLFDVSRNYQRRHMEGI